MRRLFGRSGIVGAEWQPTNKEGCTFWLRSDLAWQDATKTVPCTNESLIWVGEDKSLDNDFVQATEAKRPVYLTNQINGHPVWRFDGIDDFLKCVYSTIHTELTLAIVLKWISDVHNTFALSLNNNAAGFSPYFFDKSYFNSFGVYSWTLGTREITGNAVDANPTILFGTIKDGDVIELFQDNVSKGSLSVTNMWTDWSQISLASYSDTAGFANLDIAEVIKYNSALSSADRALVQNYLNGRYRIY